LNTQVDCALHADTIRKRWDDTASAARYHPYPEATDDGLIYGAATRLAARGAPAGSGDATRAHALLSVAAGRSVPPERLRFLRRALDQWARGEKALAQFELAFAQFPRLASRDDAWPLFWADALMAGGLPPGVLLRGLGLAENATELIRSGADEPRIPPGHGRQSGEWTTGGGAEQQLHPLPTSPIQKYEVGPRV
jgi:hypothetical protein